jgi:hypothetical protein
MRRGKARASRSELNQTSVRLTLGDSTRPSTHNPRKPAIRSLNSLQLPLRMSSSDNDQIPPQPAFHFLIEMVRVEMAQHDAVHRGE